MPFSFSQITNETNAKLIAELIFPVENAINISTEKDEKYKVFIHIYANFLRGYACGLLHRYYIDIDTRYLIRY